MAPTTLFSAFSEWVQSLPPLIILLMVFCAGWFGFFMDRRGRGKKSERIMELEKDLTHAEKRMSSLKQYKEGVESSMAALKVQDRKTGSFIADLPDAVEKLSTSANLKDLLHNLVNITESFLNARDISVFLRKRDLLILKAESGAQPLPSPSLTIRIGEGKIGWAAQKEIVMTDRDFEQESNLVKENLAKDHTDRQTKICSPLIYNGKLLGVLNIGEMEGNMEQGLTTVKIITSLGSLSLGNMILKKQIQSGSEKDGLTGLYNLQFFLNELRKELSKARRYKRPLSLCHFNIDSFQQYNKLNGYPAGDESLIMISRIFMNHLRSHDMVARYGGKEFVLICPETKREDATVLAEKLRKIIQDSPFPHRDRMPGGRLTVSGGVVGYPEDGTDEAELIRTVVEATRKSKNSGRNCITLHGLDH